MAYPSIISVFATPQPTDKLNSPSHSTLHQNENTAITEIETFVGTLSSTQGTLVYDIRSSNSNGGGHVQTANKGGTGQTSYTKGDLLVGTSSSVLSKFAVTATDGYALIADSTQAAGIRWGVPGNRPTIRVYGFSPSVITWNKPSTLSYLIVEAVGGGTGGSKTNSNPPGASGGAGGSYGKKVIPASSLALTDTLVVGSGGAGATSAGAGGAGSVSSFGSSSIMTSSNADLVISGFSGGTGGGIGGATAGNGGNSGGGFGLGGISSTFGGAGTPQGFGGGGKGGEGTGNGQDGANGIVIVYEF